MLPVAMIEPVPPAARTAACLLLVLLTLLATLSADQAGRLGIATFRMPAFVVAAGSLVVLALAIRPAIDEWQLPAPVLLLLLVGIMALLDLRGTVDPIDYKLMLPVLVMLAAQPIAALLEPLDLPLLVWRVLTLYVLATMAVVLLNDPADLARGADGIVRIDASGSLVTHTAFCVLQLVLSAAGLPGSTWPGRAFRLATGGCALFMLLAAATRTPFLTLVLAGAMLLVVSRDRARWFRRLAMTALAGGLALFLQTTLVDDSLWRRLRSDGQAEWSTGRTVAIDHWVDQALDHPLGIGLGGVRDALGDEKPALSGEAILDWPHNEAVRLWVEAGPFGLAFLLLLLGTIVTRAIAACRDGSPVSHRVLAVTLAADAVVQTMCQNWLNGVYHATFGTLVICVLAGLRAQRHTTATTRLTPQPSAD